MRRDRRAGPADRGSMRAVQAANIVSIALALLFARWRPDFAIKTFRIPAALAGIAAVVAGGLLRRHCFRMLGDSFTYDVRVSAAQAVVERGAYRYVRHPSYTAGILLFAGLGAAIGNWISLVVLIVLPLVGYAYRIAVEERALLETLGPAYAGYMTRTRRLIPFVF